LAGISNLPFRMVAKEHGAALTVTEMVSAAGLCHGAAKTMNLMASSPLEKPFSVQIFGKDPERMARAAEVAVDAGADIVDINMGCPARKVVRHGSGAALLKDFRLIERILRAVRRVLRAPLTVKTRAGWSPGEGEIHELAPILINEGVDAVTLHPRWAVQGFGGKADWDLLPRLAEVFPGPVIGNGDITRPQHVLTRLKSTGCAGIMIGRGALGNPWLFQQALSLLRGGPLVQPDVETRQRIAENHAVRLKEHVGLPTAIYMLRSVLMWYTKGLPESAQFRRSINQIKEFEELIDRLGGYFTFLAQVEQAGDLAA
jgi:nifR3 family TIM-barrel protein